MEATSASGTATDPLPIAGTHSDQPKRSKNERMQSYICSVYDSSDELIIRNTKVHIRNSKRLGLELIGAVEIPESLELSAQEHNHLNLITQAGLHQTIYPVSQRGKYIYFLNASSDFK